MHADNEVTVDRVEFREAVNWIWSGRRARRDQTIFYLADDGFTVETAKARTKIKSVGRWTCKVAVYSAPLKGVAAKLPRTKELSLRYFDGWLSVGSTRLSALVVQDEEF